MKRKQIVLNAATTFIQVLGSAGVLFFLYRFLIRMIGIERLGIWSLVLATTSVVVLANQGFSTGIVKFVAKYSARDQAENVSILLQTGVLSAGLAAGLISICLYPGATWILRLVVPHANLAEACAILPLALLSLWLNIMYGILQAGLAGHELITLCNYVELGAAGLYLVLAYAFVPGYGLMGLAYSQAADAAACLAITWFLLRRTIPRLPLFPHRWHCGLFREMAAYGLHFQLVTASQSVREPVTKALLTKFGGLALTGFYDMASRFVVTFRELIVQANQVLVPTVSNLQERKPEVIPIVYRESYRLVFFLAIPSFAFLTVISPLVSRIWIGYYEPIFVQFVAFLAVGWVVNVLGNPAYVVDLGTGALRWVSVGCLATAVLNAGLGYVAGWYAGGTAVVAASVFSLAAGYIIILVAYHHENGVPFAQLLPKESLGIVFSSCAGALIFLPLFCASAANPLFSVRVATGAVVALITMAVIPMWIHPMRKRLVHWILSRVPA